MRPLDHEQLADIYDRVVNPFTGVILALDLLSKLDGDREKLLAEAEETAKILKGAIERSMDVLGGYRRATREAHGELTLPPQG